MFFRYLAFFERVVGRGVLRGCAVGAGGLVWSRDGVVFGDMRVVGYGRVLVGAGWLRGVVWRRFRFGRVRVLWFRVGYLGRSRRVEVFSFVVGVSVVEGSVFAFRCSSSLSEFSVALLYG